MVFNINNLQSPKRIKGNTLFSKNLKVCFEEIFTRNFPFSLSGSVLLGLNYHFSLRTMRSESLLLQNQDGYKHRKCDAKQ